jgi:hypothetical protein
VRTVETILTESPHALPQVGRHRPHLDGGRERHTIFGAIEQVVEQA